MVAIAGRRIRKTDLELPPEGIVRRDLGAPYAKYAIPFVEADSIEAVENVSCTRTVPPVEFSSVSVVWNRTSAVPQQLGDTQST
ncbi:MAG: hypothetical protein QOI88_2312 [Gammaproteobacteria bacterium]|jgi:hypothetical protein|nr:hypothetical protein [Gammaproteobacteria bacterium]